MEEPEPARSETEGESFAALLRGGAEAREGACSELLRLEAEHHASGGDSGFVEIAVACTAPLCDVLCRPVGEVGVEEYHRACQVLTALSGVDPVRVGGECLKPGTHNFWTGVLMAPDSALAAALAKEPAALTLEDALTIAWIWAPVPVQYSTTTGCDVLTHAAGIGLTELFGMVLPASFLLVTATPTDDRSLVLTPLLLELLKALDDLPEFALGESADSLAFPRLSATLELTTKAFPLCRSRSSLGAAQRRGRPPRRRGQAPGARRPRGNRGHPAQSVSG
jgi:hypothetical protein